MFCNGGEQKYREVLRSGQPGGQPQSQSIVPPERTAQDEWCFMKEAIQPLP
jgi:hypothetical protein